MIANGRRLEADYHLKLRNKISRYGKNITNNEDHVRYNECQMKTSRCNPLDFWGKLVPHDDWILQ